MCSLESVHMCIIVFWRVIRFNSLNPSMLPSCLVFRIFCKHLHEHILANIVPFVVLDRLIIFVKCHITTGLTIFYYPCPIYTKLIAVLAHSKLPCFKTLFWWNMHEFEAVQCLISYFFRKHDTVEIPQLVHHLNSCWVACYAQVIDLWYRPLFKSTLPCCER